MNENTNENTMFISCGTLQCLFVYINDELQTTVVTVLLCCKIYSSKVDIYSHVKSRACAVKGLARTTHVQVLVVVGA